MRRALPVLLCVAACAKAPVREGGLQVTVELGAGLLSHCVQVVVTAPGGGSQLRTMAIGIDGLTKVEVGIAQGALPATVKVFAEGFSDAACTVATAPQERTINVDATFERGAIGQVTLTLQPAMGREVACSNGTDDDGDEAFDCADPDCDQRPCAGGGDCAARVCSGASSEKALCADRADNDGDGQVDCDDDDCLGATCAAADPCLVEAKCSAAKTCTGGTAKSCPATGACAQTAGTCDAVTGQCRYAFTTAGAGCDDGNACTTGDACDGLGACRADAGRVCDAAPSACFTATGSTCDPARGCVYTAVAGGACDDGDPCTTGESCAADGGCAGTRVACASSGCQTFLGCGADAGCLFTSSDAGAGCDGGVCNATGSCVPLFPYPPSNFTEADVPSAPPGEVLLNCGVSVIDTGVTGPPTFTNWCGQALPGAAALAQAGGPGALLLGFTKLTVAAGATLQVRGPRPVIVAATGDVTIAGVLEAFAGAADCADAGAGTRGGGGLTNGGGGGGSFASSGGNGGTGSLTLGSSGPGGLAGVLGPVPTLVPLRGGCSGGLGAASGASRAAAGGGALQISSATAVLVSGTISAPGQGGPQAGNGTGGNGAGSGGGLLLEGLLVTISSPAVLAANGGGGGEGGGPLVDGQAGRPGTADGGTAAGGNSLATGGAGGHGAAGSVGASNAADGNSGTGNGGGGGGGLGRIRVRASIACSVGVGVVVSPPMNFDGGC